MYRLSLRSQMMRFIQTQPAITCLQLTIEVLEQGVKYVTVKTSVLVSLLLILNIFRTLF